MLLLLLLFPADLEIVTSTEAAHGVIVSREVGIRCCRGISPSRLLCLTLAADLRPRPKDLPAHNHKLRLEFRHLNPKSTGEEIATQKAGAATSSLTAKN
jgi:hypothetical protein